jgi:hypothetical protein
MRKTFIAAVAASFLCAAAFGQASGVSLQNQEASTFYYVVDPPALSGLTAGSPLLSTKVAEFFAAPNDATALVSLAPDSEVKLDGLADGPHLLVGFFDREGRSEFPVRVISLQVDGRIGIRFYAIFAEPALLTVPRGTGRLAAFGRPAKPHAAADQAAASVQQAAAGSEQAAATASAVMESVQDAGSADLQPIASFAQSYDPGVFTRERQGEFSVLPVSASRAWALTGTRISALSGLLENGTLRLSLAAPGGFSEQVSYFFYVFKTRTPGSENQVTLELKPRAKANRGACILWRKGDASPRLLGAVTVTGTMIEVDIDVGRLPPDVLAEIGDAPTFDLTAGWFDRARGTWEEFSYTTFSMADISATR